MTPDSTAADLVANGYGPSGLSEDFCKCGHVASAHAEGAGPCDLCRIELRTTWAALVRCQNFRWSETWQEAPGAA